MATMFMVILLSLLTFFLLYFIYSLLASAFSAKTPHLPVPPGSMGWPYFGETFQLFSKDPYAFFSHRQKRYGSIFKTHILGCPCVMVSTSEAAKFVLVSNAHLFKPTFPASKERMLGQQAIFFQQGEYHARLRKIIQHAFVPEAIRDSVCNIEEVAVNTLKSWEGRMINTFQEMKLYAFNVALLSIFGKEEILYIEELKQCYHTLEKGYNSLPINLPGTLFYNAMKARRDLSQIVANIISSRRKMRAEVNDLLGSFMQDNNLDDDQITDNIIGALFAARDTTASVLTWLIKFLGENPNLLQAVTEEHEEIIKNKEMGKGKKHLTWSDTKRMTLTSKVVQETMRVASVLSFTYREAVEDVEYEGYLIPKGWKVLPLFRNIHHSEEYFPDPQKFDPARFDVAPKPNTFLPFGTGAHSCPGNELAKLEMLVLLHHLTTKYRWSLLASWSGIQFLPFALPRGGLPVTFTLKTQL